QPRREAGLARAADDRSDIDRGVDLVDPGRRRVPEDAIGADRHEADRLARNLVLRTVIERRALVVCRDPDRLDAGTHVPHPGVRPESDAVRSATGTRRNALHDRSGEREHDDRVPVVREPDVSVGADRERTVRVEVRVFREGHVRGYPWPRGAEDGEETGEPPEEAHARRPHGTGAGPPAKRKLMSQKTSATSTVPSPF